MQGQNHMPQFRKIFRLMRTQGVRSSFQIVLVFTSLRAENLLLSVRAGAKTLAAVPRDFLLDAHARRAFSFQVVLDFTSLRAGNLLLSVQAGTKTLAAVPQDCRLGILSGKIQSLPCHVEPVETSSRKAHILLVFFAPLDPSMLSG